MNRHAVEATVTSAEAPEPRLSDLSLVLASLERIEAALAKPDVTRILSFNEVPTFYPNITVREIRSACAQPDGPRKFKPGYVSTREIEAWIKRREQKVGVR